MLLSFNFLSLILCNFTKPNCSQLIKLSLIETAAEAARLGIQEIAAQVNCLPLIVETNVEEVVSLVLNKKGSQTEIFGNLLNSKQTEKLEENLSSTML